ncbi:MAG TPA: MarR family transcriptional regulator [Mucilaginibacter sp.]|jgi:DNA-binding MarR family transcriptional regulator
MIENKDLQFASDLRGVITRLIKKLRKESPTGLQLSLTERSTMSMLHQHKTLQPSELAAMEMITNQSMSEVLNHLFELGYIIRTPSETDKRKVNISLSKKGETMLQQVRHERDEWLTNAIAEACTSEEQMILKQVIAPLTKLVDFRGG